MTPATVMVEVERVMAARWEWGVADCCTAACDVFAALHGVDPMAAIRGRYNTAIGAYRIIREWGGFPAMAEALARSAGLSVGAGAPGEIGLSAPGHAGGPDGRALLICVQPGHWAGKSETGFTILPGAERCWHA